MDIRRFHLFWRAMGILQHVHNVLIKHPTWKLADLLRRCRLLDRGRQVAEFPDTPDLARQLSLVTGSEGGLDAVDDGVHGGVADPGQLVFMVSGERVIWIGTRK